jgi:N-hydroxyarylamine O-acetyltransferase
MESSLPSALNQHGAGPTPVALDLDAYCARINYTGSREVSAATLKGLHYAHVHNVPFENLDIHLGQVISLEPSALFRKIVTHKRGGYCYEVNSFFAMVLQAFGFQLQCLLARVLYGFSNFRPRSHQLLLVTAENESWIADVGFGSCCLREPLRLAPGVVSEQGADSFRLKTEAGQTYILEAMLAGRWQDLYAFTLEPFDLVDYEPFNYWNSTSPHVRWTQQKICTIPTKDGRVVAIEREFKIHGRQGTQTITAKTHEDYLELLRAHFGLEITGCSSNEAEETLTHVCGLMFGGDYDHQIIRSQ